MTDNITPEFLAKMHAALRGSKYGDPAKHGVKKKPVLATSSMASASPVGANSASGKLDGALAESVAQTTAGTAANMADGPKPEAPKAEAKPAEGGDKGSHNTLLDEVMASEIHEVENAILNPLLDKAAPPPIEDGIFEIKDTHGQLIQRTPYVKGKIKGEVQFFDPQGNLIQTQYCVDGIKQGPMRYFDTQGSMTCEIPYVKDKQEGMGTFYVNGTKVAELTFHEDKMEGPAIYYASEGYVSTAALYHDSALQGEMRCFDAQQCLIKSCHYVKGKLSGKSLLYYPGGAKIFECMEYADNVPVGKCVRFYEDGTVMSIREYDKGQLMKEKFYTPKGKEIKKEQGEKITNLFPDIPGWKRT